ncbi:MAG TPA: hypothetical protein VF190_07590 [Rhodothermales bacterium]
MTWKRSPCSIFAAALFTGLAAANVALAAGVAPEPAGQDAIASGLTDNGMVEARVVEASRKDGILSIKVRFVPLVKDASYSETIYDDLSELQRDLYVLVGGQKYLLLQDSQGKPLASPTLEIEIEEGHPYAGYWYGRFHAPPPEVKQVSLTLPGVEPIEPIAITNG